MSLYRGPSLIGTSTDTTHAQVLSATAAAITAANEAAGARLAKEAIEQLFNGIAAINTANGIAATSATNAAASDAAALVSKNAAATSATNAAASDAAALVSKNAAATSAAASQADQVLCATAQAAVAAQSPIANAANAAASATAAATSAIAAATSATNAATAVAPAVHAATSKVTPVDADELPIADSASSFSLKKLTWGNLKATAKTYFDGLYATRGTLAASGITGAAASGANTNITSLGVINSINGGQLAGLRNQVINGGFAINQRAYASGAAVGTSLYAHDRWKMAASADTYTFSTTANKTTITIPAGKLLYQVIEGLNLQSGTYTLSWEGTALGNFGGSGGSSGLTNTITGGTNTLITFGAGTVANVQLELGSVATVFEQRPYGMELALCQRYYLAISCIGGAGYQVAGATVGTQIIFPVTMRATPTMAFVSAGTTVNINIGTGAFFGTSQIGTLGGYTATTSNNASFYGAIATASIEL